MEFAVQDQLYSRVVRDASRGVSLGVGPALLPLDLFFACCLFSMCCLFFPCRLIFPLTRIRFARSSGDRKIARPVAANSSY